jgi:hypothetical protein
MANLKHIGRMKATGRKVLVAYRTLPGESDSALIVQTENLSDDQHDLLIRLVESPAGQSSNEFAEVMARTQFSDGSIMLANLHVNGRLTKVKTSDVEMVPNQQVTISLDQLNQIIAEQKGISVNDLALGNKTTVQEVAEVTDISNLIDPSIAAESQVANIPNANSAPLSDEDLAKKFRSDADRLSKEAAELRRQAEALAPTKKKTTSKA